eukprot:237259-Chlamydomonas_euryale.AAC.4
MHVASVLSNAPTWCSPGKRSRTTHINDLSRAGCGSRWQFTVLCTSLKRAHVHTFCSLATSLTSNLSTQPTCQWERRLHSRARCNRGHGGLFHIKASGEGGGFGGGLREAWREETEHHEAATRGSNVAQR